MAYRNSNSQVHFSNGTINMRKSTRVYSRIDKVLANGDWVTTFFFNQALMRSSNTGWKTKNYNVEINTDLVTIYTN